MSELLEYARSIVALAGQSFASGEIFAKVLSTNDDSGRHGVLVPTDAYSYFPTLPIPDPTHNETGLFRAFDVLGRKWKSVAYKYYQRYPERRVTRLNPMINDLRSEWRLVVFLHARHEDGTTAYYFDSITSASNGRFDRLFRTIYGEDIQPAPGVFVVRPVDAVRFSIDANLAQLLGLFDGVREQGWIDSKRSGDTGIGYTFETLLGIKENNDQIADFRGIEIKCKGVRDGDTAGSAKVTLFQLAPTWNSRTTAVERVRLLGKCRPDGSYACYSQVTTRQNNLGLLLVVLRDKEKVDLQKRVEAVGYWPFKDLQARLAEKHSRAVFVKAKSRQACGVVQYRYEELVYCERPNIHRFVDLVSNRSIVFEFTMSEKANGTVRNHGYPWRLGRSELLDQLFDFQIRLR